MLDRYLDSGVTVHPLAVELPSLHPRHLSTVLVGVRRLVQETGPDVVHLHNVGVALAVRRALGKQHRVPRVFQVPGPLHMEHRASRRVELATAGPADFWLASCEYTRRLYLSAGVPSARVSMSYYGTAVDEYSRAPGASGALREELVVAEDTKIVGMVAYMYAPKRYLGQRSGLKGHEDLIDAMALCMRERRDLIVVFIGGAWAGATGYEAKVRSYGRKRCGDRAVFLGTRGDVPRLYPDIDVAVHPSHSENVGGAVESLLLGVPTIASAVGGLPELVRPGETGWLVPARDPNSLRDAVLEALGDQAHARKLAVRGGELARQLFDVRHTAKEVLAFYGQVLSTSPAPRRL